MQFPYQKTPGGIYYPIISIFTSHNGKSIQTDTLIDSGATISIFKTHVAEELHIRIDQGKKIFLGGVGGRIKGFIHHLNLKIADKKIKAPVVFSHEFFASFNLLGRETVFKNFQITFDEKNLQVILK